MVISKDYPYLRVKVTVRNFRNKRELINDVQEAARTGLGSLNSGSGAPVASL